MLGAIAVLLERIFADNILRFIAMKTILTTLFVVVLPIVLNNFVYSLLEYAISQVSSINVSALPSLVLNFAGLSGWFFSQLYLPDALSVVISAISVRVFLDHIPFLRV